MTRFFGYTILPAISVAVIAYFGYYAVWGERGYLELDTTQVKLAEQQATLDTLIDQRERLEHRVALLRGRNPDPDLIQELARRKLMDGAPGQIAVPRNQQ